MQRLKVVVATASKKNMVVLLNPHNYARYYGKVVVGPDVSDAAFADFWGAWRLSSAMTRTSGSA